jgi:hypothetical protein
MITALKKQQKDGKNDNLLFTLYNCCASGINFCA